MLPDQVAPMPWGRPFVRCVSCGKPLTASYSRGRHGKRYPYHHCARNAGGCVRISKAKLEGAFLDQLRGLRPHPELVAIWRDIVRDVWDTRKASLEKTCGGSNAASPRSSVAARIV